MSKLVEINATTQLGDPAGLKGTEIAGDPFKRKMLTKEQMEARRLATAQVLALANKDATRQNGRGTAPSINGAAVSALTNASVLPASSPDGTTKPTHPVDRWIAEMNAPVPNVV